MGGTFDPVHNGHAAIAKSFLKSGYIDELWIILTPRPPHKPGEEVTAYHHRLEMLKLAFEDWDRVVLSEIERELPEPSYTIQTLEHLASAFPDYSFILCIGSDSLRQFREWHRWRDILDMCELLVARRPDAERVSTGYEEIEEKSHYISHEPVEISSTEIREMISGNKKIPGGLLPEQVYRYIRNQNLYTNNTAP